MNLSLPLLLLQMTSLFQSGAHHGEVMMKVPIDGKECILDLRLNHDLVTDNHVLSYQENGKTVLHKPKKEVSIKIFKFQEGHEFFIQFKTRLIQLTQRML